MNESACILFIIIVITGKYLISSSSLILGESYFSSRKIGVYSNSRVLSKEVSSLEMSIYTFKCQNTDTFRR